MPIIMFLVNASKANCARSRNVLHFLHTAGNSVSSIRINSILIDGRARLCACVIYSTLNSSIEQELSLSATGPINVVNNFNLANSPPM